VKQIKGLEKRKRSDFTRKEGEGEGKGDGCKNPNLSEFVKTAGYIRA
jgi:hypothetical protein